MNDALHYAPHAIGGSLGSLILWFIKREWTAMRAKIDLLGDNHLTHVQAELHDLGIKQDMANEKSDQQIELLSEVAKGIAVLVDRGHR